MTRLLVDTHVWLWMLTEPERLSTIARGLIEDADNELLLSAASAWEIAIKHRIGKLSLPEPPHIYVPDRMRRSGMTPLPVEHAHALRTADLPDHHRDPFDRVLVAQAQLLAIPVVTADVQLRAYEIGIVEA